MLSAFHFHKMVAMENPLNTTTAKDEPGHLDQDALAPNGILKLLGASLFLALSLYFMYDHILLYRYGELSVGTITELSHVHDSATVKRETGETFHRPLLFGPRLSGLRKGQQVQVRCLKNQCEISSALTSWSHGLVLLISIVFFIHAVATFRAAGAARKLLS